MSSCEPSRTNVVSHCALGTTVLSKAMAMFRGEMSCWVSTCEIVLFSGHSVATSLIKICMIYCFRFSGPSERGNNFKKWNFAHSTYAGITRIRLLGIISARNIKAPLLKIRFKDNGKKWWNKSFGSFLIISKIYIGKYFNECQTCISSESKISSVISDPDAWIIKYAEFSFEGKSIISHFQIVFQKVCKFHNKLFLTVLLQK